MPALTEKKHAGAFLLREAPRQFSRENGFVGGDAAAHQPGLVLGKIIEGESAGEYRALDPNAEDGTEVPAGILHSKFVGGRRNAVVIVRDAEALDEELIWPDLTASQKRTMRATLAAAGVVVRVPTPQAGEEPAADPQIIVTGTFDPPEWVWGGTVLDQDFPGIDGDLSAAETVTFVNVTGVSGNFVLDGEYSALTSVDASSVTEIGGDVEIVPVSGGESLTVDLSGLTTIGGVITVASVNAVDLSALVTANNFTIGASVVDLSVDLLQNVGNLSISSPNIALPSLVVVNGEMLVATSVSSLAVPELAEISGNLDIQGIAAEELEFPSLTEVGGTINVDANSIALGTVSFPVLTTAGALNIWNELEEVAFVLSLPLLATVTQDFRIEAYSMTSLALPALATVGGTFTATSNDNLASLDLSALTACGAVSISENGLLTAIDLSALETLGADGIEIDYCGLLVNAPSLSALLSNSGKVRMTSNAFSEASVDAILVRLAAMDGTAGTTSYDNQTVDLSGGTNAPPSATGLAAKATLEGRGCTVEVNA